MSDAVNRVLSEREALDTGLSASVALSVTAHGLLLAAGLLAPFIFPKPPPLQVQEGFVVTLPRGGGGTPGATAPAPPPPAAQPAPQPEPAAPEPPPRILKPPKEEPRRRGLPEPDAKTSKKPKKPTPTPPRAGATAGVAGARGAVPGGTGTSSATPGLEFGPPGPGVPGGTDLFGDWYLAGVQRKIWLIWTQQLQTGFSGQIRVSFTILANGSVEDVRVVEPSSVALLNLAAQRAVISAAPFGPLPRNYGTNRFTIQAIFKPNQ